MGKTKIYEEGEPIGGDRLPNKGFVFFRDYRFSTWFFGGRNSLAYGHSFPTKIDFVA